MRGLDPERWRARVVLALDGPLAEDLSALGADVFVSSLPVVRRADGLGGVVRLTRASVPSSFGVGASLVHANTSVIVGASRLGLPVVTHVREIYPRPAWPVLRRLVRRSSAVVCVSGAVAAQFANRPSYRAMTRREGRSRAEVVYDGLAVEAVRAPRDTARAHFGIEGDRFVVAVAGRISDWKGQSLLVRALAAVPDAVALIAGDAWPGNEAAAEEVRAAASAGGVSLVMPGFVADPSLVWGAADVVAVPSVRPDPFPNTALEAAAAGCCVVAARHGGLVEMLSDGETGVLVAPGDEAALRAALVRLKDDPELRDRLGRAAADDVRARFTPARMAAQIDAIYTRVAG